MATTTLVAVAALYRPLALECFDPVFLRSAGEAGGASYVEMRRHNVTLLVAAMAEN